MNSKKEVQHVYLVGAKSLGAYGGYETFVYKLTEYHQNKENIKYHVACKANGDGCMDESKFEGVTKINDHEFELHNAHCFKIDVPQIGSAQAIYYDVAALKACCEHILTLLTLPLLVVVWLLKWFVMFLYCCSAWIFYLLGSVLFATAVLSFLMKQSQGMEALQMLIGGFVIFMIPQVVGSVVVFLELVAATIRQVWYI